MKNFVKKILRKCGIEVKRKGTGIEIIRNTPDTDYQWQTVSLKPKQVAEGNVLISYRTEPFLLEDGHPKLKIHQAFFECFQIAKTFLDFGYNVDVIDWRNDRFMPKKDYAFFTDVHSNLAKIGKRINADCVKILTSQWAHWMFHNAAEYQRCIALQQRRETLLMPNRQLPPIENIEHADYLIVKGNEFTRSTFGYAKKPIYLIPVGATTTYPWHEDRDYETCRNNFIWLGGYGFVHKGLDLVLEAFAQMPGHHLTVCGPIELEKNFERVYYKELFHTPNIHTLGRVDVTSQNFMEITKECVGLVFPSCSESQSGAVVTCMHAGLIPVISYECGIDIDNFGLILDDCNVETIKSSVRKLSNLPPAELKEMSRKTWEFVRENHTRQRVVEAYREVIGGIISRGSHGNKSA